MLLVSAAVISFTKTGPDTPKQYFTLWNSCEALTVLQEYVQDVTDPSSRNYIKPEDRIATFDMDVKLKSSGQGDEEGVNYTFGKGEDLIRTDQLIIKNFKTIYGDNVKTVPFSFED